MSSTSWKTGVNGDWSDAGDWSSGTVPNASNSVTIAAPSRYTITVSTAEAAGLLDLNASGATLLADAALDIVGTLAAAQGEIAIAAGQTLSLPAAVSFGLLNNNGFSVGGPGTLLTTGSVTVLAQPSYDEIDLYVGGGATWVSSGTVTDAGLIHFGFGYNDTGAFINQAGGVFDLTTDNAAINPNNGGDTATFTNAGLLEKTGGTATSTIEATVTNAATGTIAATSGTLSITGSLEGTGKLEIGANSALAFTGAVSQAVTFNGTDATLILEQPTLYTGTLGGMQNGDTIYLAGITASQPTIGGDTLTIQRSGGAALVYNLLGDFSGETITAAAVSGGTDIVFGPGAVVTTVHKAQPSVTTPSPVILHVGDTGSEALTIGNVATPPAESLIANVTGATGGVTTGASTTGDIADQGSATLPYTISTSTAGTIAGTINLQYISDGTGIDSNGQTTVGTAAVPIAAVINNYTTAHFFTSDGTEQGGIDDVGDVGVGEPDAPSVDLLVSNDAAAPADNLTGTVSESGSGFTYSGSGTVSDLAAGAGPVDVGTVSLDTSMPGTFTETFVLDSYGTNSSGYQGALPEQTITIVGTVSAALAVPVINSGTVVDLGTERVGESQTTPVTITNAATTATAGDLQAFYDNAAATGNVAGSGPGITNLAPGDSDSTDIAVGLSSTATAGVYSGALPIDFTSVATTNNSVNQPTPLPSQTIEATGTVDNEAIGTLQAFGGTLVQVGPDSYILTLTSVTQGGSSGSVLQLLNIAPTDAPADQLAATVEQLQPSSQFENDQLSQGLLVSAGGTGVAGVISLDTSIVGPFSAGIDIHQASVNNSESAAALPTIYVQVDGTVLPSSTIMQPGTTASPSPLPSPAGVAWGDVHFIDYDGLTYNFQAEGEFILTRATAAGDDFQVQARLQPYYNGASVTVMTQVAAAVGADRVTFGIGRAATVWIDGAASGLSAANPVITLAGGILTELSGSTYQINWNTGQSLTVSDIGSYFNVTIKGIPGSGAGALVGLLGSDSGPANDFQLADGTVIPQPLTTQQLYGEYADAWRVTDATSLLDYGAGQDTATFTDLNFPSDVVSVASLPGTVVQNAEALVQSAGITNPGIAQGAIEDYALTSDPSFIDSAADLQNLVATSTITPEPANAGTTTAVGIAATADTVVESTTGTTAVTFDIYRLGPTNQAQVVDYTVLAQGTADVGAGNFAGGVLPSGQVTIAAGATSTMLTIEVTGSIGNVPEETLFTQIDTAQSGVAVVAPTASVIIANAQPVEGSPAIAAFLDPGDVGTLSQSGSVTTLNLGTLSVDAIQAPVAIDLVNQGAAGSDLLSGAFSISSATGVQIAGLGQVTGLASGSVIPLTVSLDTTAAGEREETIDFAPVDSNSSGFQVGLTGVSLTVEADVVACFRQGTRIATAAGETPVEALREGDLVFTQSGDLVPISWIGRRALDCSRHLDPRKVWPVCVRAGALAADAPRRDLWLSPDHAIFVDEVLIPVKYLINETSVVQTRQIQVVYYHIELARHDILLAEGLKVESLLPSTDRSVFENNGGSMQLHPDFHRLAWEAQGCAPLVVTGVQLEAVRRRLAQRCHRVPEPRSLAKAA